MTRSDDRLTGAVAAGVLGADATHAALLQSIVASARAIFDAKAASIMLYDPETHELVFEAVSGEGEGTIVGQRLPAGTGIAGWVLSSGESMIVEDVTQDPRFARAIAERTGYVPKVLMAAPLHHGEETIGVLNVLDRRRSQFATANEVELLGMFANHAAIALSVVHASRRAKRVLDDGDAESLVVARIAAALERLSGSRREAGLKLLSALDELHPAADQARHRRARPLQRQPRRLPRARGPARGRLPRAGDAARRGQGPQRPHRRARRARPLFE